MMDQDRQMALKQFWQKVKRLRRGMPSSSNTLYSPAGVLLTSTEDTFGWLKEYLEHTFSPTSVPGEASHPSLGMKTMR